MLVDDRCRDCTWLKDMSERFSGGSAGVAGARDCLISTWYLVGLIGIKDDVSHRIHFSLDRALNPKSDLRSDATFTVLKMLRSALGITERVV